MPTSTITDEMLAQIELFATILLAARQEELRTLYPTSDQWEWEAVEVIRGKLYTKVNVGPRHNMSGKFMIEHATGIIFGIKGYGQVHKGHRYGTIDTIDEWDWSRYQIRRKDNS